MAANDLITVGNLGDSFALDPVAEKVAINLGSGITKDPTTGALRVLLAVTTTPVVVGFASGQQNISTTVVARGCSITRTGVGEFTVVFTAPHPDGAGYEVMLGCAESGTSRDVPKVSVVAGSQAATGFNVQVTVDDNGGTADNYSDDAWSFAVMQTLSLVTGVSTV